MREKVGDKSVTACESNHASLIISAGEPVSRIRRAALQTNKLFEISRREVSMMSALAV